MPPKKPAPKSAPVDMVEIEKRIQTLRAEMNAQRDALKELRERRMLSPQTIEVLLTDLLDIWEWSGQLVGTHRQTREELAALANAQRDLAHELRVLNALLERRNDRRIRWQARIRQRPAPAPPLADLRFVPEAEASREAGGEGVGGAGEGAQVQPGDSEA